MNKSSGNKLSQIVKKLREEKGLSQEKLARLSDVSNNTIVNIKRANRTIPPLIL